MLAAGAAAGLMAGCSSTAQGQPHSPAASSPSARSAVVAAYERTTATRSAKFTLSADVSGGAAQQVIHVGASGVIDFRNRASELTVTLPGSAGNVEIRYLSGVVYAKLPAALSGRLPGNRPWVSADLGKLSQARLGEPLPQLGAVTPSDPGQVLAYLRGAGQDVKDAGPATVDGVATTCYTTTIDLDKAAAALPATARGGLTQVEKQLGTHLLPAQLWIDGQGRLRQITIAAQRAELTLGLTDFGTAVHVAAPPADETTDLTALLAGGH